MSAETERDEIPAARRASARGRWSWIATILGFAVILAGVLHFTSATVGGRVREFHERRTYNEVKLAAHRAIPVTALLGVVGAGLVFLGARLRGTRQPTEPSA